MNDFYILDFVVTTNAYIAKKVTLTDMYVYDRYADGVSLKEKNFEIILHKGRGELLHFVNNLYGLPIVSEEITNILLEYCKNEVETYPVKLMKNEKLQYSFINILNLVDAIDFEESDCETMDPNIKLLEKLVLFEDKISERNIFRLQGLKLQIVISNKLKNSLEKFPELKFTTIEDFKYDLNSFEW